MNCIITYCTEDYIWLLNKFLVSIDRHGGYRGYMQVLYYVSPNEDVKKSFSRIEKYNNVGYTLKAFTGRDNITAQSRIDAVDIIGSTDYKFYAFCDCDLFFISDINHLFGKEYEANITYGSHDPKFSNSTRSLDCGWAHGLRDNMLKLFELYKGKFLEENEYYWFLDGKIINENVLNDNYVLLDCYKYSVKNYKIKYDGVVFYHVHRNMRPFFYYFVEKEYNLLRTW